MSSDSEYNPSAVDVRDITTKDLPDIWGDRTDDHAQFTVHMQQQEYWYYPTKLSGGKHENTFLCFADAAHTLPFVLKLLPTALSSLPHASAAGTMEPAALEFLIYQRLQHELASGRTLHYPCLYHAAIMTIHDLTDRIVFASAQIKERLKRLHLPEPASSTHWRAFADAQTQPRFLCLLIEYSALTSIKAWYHKIRNTMNVRRGGKAVDWSLHGLLGYVSRGLEIDAARGGAWKPWKPRRKDEYPCVPRTYHLQPEWTCILDQPSWTTVWRSIIFQVMFALEYMHRLFPGFRHFDLHAGNILLMPVGDEHKWPYPVCLKYNIDGVVHAVPFVGVTVQLFDFDFAQTGQWHNSKIANQGKALATRHGIGPHTLAQYDTHLFLTSFQSLGHQLDADTRAFLNDQIKKGYRMNQKYTVGGSSKGQSNRFRLSYRVEHAKNLALPLEVIGHPFFDSCRQTRGARFLDDKVWCLPP